MNARWTKSVWVVLAVGLLALEAQGLAAQRGPRRGGPDMQNREQLMQRIRARFGEMIRQELELDDEQAQRLGEVVRTVDEERRELAREEQAVRRRVEALMLEGGEDEAEALELLGRLRDLRAEEARLFAAEQERLLEVLDPVKLLWFMALRERMAERIRALSGGGRGRGPGGDSGVGAWPLPGRVPLG